MRLLLLTMIMGIALILTSCHGDDSRSESIIFATSADYPPFEFLKNNEITGFDIELAKLIAKELGKEAKFANIKFSAVMAALQNETADAAISTITITEGRKQRFDFSDVYYTESLSIVYKDGAPLKDGDALKHKKIACQLGTVMELWLKKHTPEAKLMLVDDNNQAIEALKAGHIDGVLVDSIQAHVFAAKNKGLGSSFIAKSDDGYGIAFKKHSKLREDVNRALHVLKERGELDKLRAQWLESSSWIS